MPDASPLTKEVDKLFALVRRYDGTDLHIKVGTPPMLRIGGKLRALDMKPLSFSAVEKLSAEMIGDEGMAELREKGDIDLAYSVSGEGRFRVNMFVQRGAISIAARRVNTEIPSFEDLHLPAGLMERISSFDQGFVIVAGATGSGKSTSLASVIQRINSTRKAHVVTIEDPIEYLYKDEKCIINQREVYVDVPDFKSALKYVVRQDPDVILIGEMRDDETVGAALTAAETGHLVFGTLHAATVSQVFTRIYDLFPVERRMPIRLGLQMNLKAICCQKLLPSIREDIPRVPACEVMISTPMVRRLIHDGEEAKIADLIKSGEDGMQDFVVSLVQLINDELIDRRTALEIAPNPEELKMALQGIKLSDSHRIMG